jgi:hypothetical protein
MLPHRNNEFSQRKIRILNKAVEWLVGRSLLDFSLESFYICNGLTSTPVLRFFSLRFSFS